MNSNEIFGRVRREAGGGGSEALEIRRVAFSALLEDATPVSPDVLSARTGLSRDEVGAQLARLRKSGRVEIENGHVVGIAGLTIRPTRHRLRIGESVRWTWCALDAVGIMAALAATGRVESVDPEAGSDLTIEFDSGLPRSQTCLFIADGFGGGDVRANWCPQVNFFATEDAARHWGERAGIVGEVMSVADVAQQASAMWRPLI